MRFIKPSFEIWEQPAGLEGVYKQIEKVGRVCYKSEDKITEDSAKPFVERLVKGKHLSVCEHGTIYLQHNSAARIFHPLNKYYHNKYSKVKIIEEPDEKTSVNTNKVLVTTNFRVLIENGWLDDLQYMCEPTELHEKRACVKFTTSIGISREFNRHRTFSIAEQSTRYCNYSRDKFGGEISYVLPTWAYEGELYHLGTPEHAYYKALQVAEQQYMKLTKKLGMQPQQAREVLPLSTATEVVYTGFVSDWENFFKLRTLGTTGAPHPDARALTSPLREEFIKRGLLTTS